MIALGPRQHGGDRTVDLTDGNRIASPRRSCVFDRHDREARARQPLEVGRGVVLAAADIRAAVDPHHRRQPLVRPHVRREVHVEARIGVGVVIVLVAPAGDAVDRRRLRPPGRRRGQERPDHEGTRSRTHGEHEREYTGDSRHRARTPQPAVRRNCPSRHGPHRRNRRARRTSPARSDAPTLVRCPRLQTEAAIGRYASVGDTTTTTANSSVDSYDRRAGPRPGDAAGLPVEATRPRSPAVDVPHAGA